MSRASWCIGWAPGGTTGTEHHWYSKQAVTLIKMSSMVSLWTRGWWPALLMDGTSVPSRQEAGTDQLQRIQANLHALQSKVQRDAAAAGRNKAKGFPQAAGARQFRDTRTTPHVRKDCSTWLCQQPWCVLSRSCSCSPRTRSASATVGEHARKCTDVA